MEPGRPCARRRGVRFGSCVAWSLPGADAGSFANPRYAALLKADCGLLVPENALKWQATRPAPDRFDFRRFDETIAWASQHGFRMRRFPVRGESSAATSSGCARPTRHGLG